MHANEGILLESGTNEVEMLEFTLRDQGFGVNVLKIQAIEQYDPARVTGIQLAHPSVIGSYRYRESVVTLIDLGHVLAIDESDTPAAVEAVAAVVPPVGGEADPDLRIVLVMEFNGLTTAFLADGVTRIHRLSWEAISALSPYLAACASKFTGSLNIDGREILVVDMERIVADILPRAHQLFRVGAATDSPRFPLRADVPIFLVEDSTTIRETVRAELGRGNYGRVRSFANGLEAWRALEKLVADQRPLAEHVRAVVTDIEMPQMDGLALCKHIKQSAVLRELPVIMFSSLINEQVTARCASVQANATLAKPQFDKLVSLLDEMTLAGS